MAVSRFTDPFSWKCKFWLFLALALVNGDAVGVSVHVPADSRAYFKLPILVGTVGRIFNIDHRELGIKLQPCQSLLSVCRDAYFSLSSLVSIL